MRTRLLTRNFPAHFSLILALLVLLTGSISAQAWWNEEWTVRKKITVDTAAEGAAIADPIGTTTVLIRLHDGNFQFVNAREDGSDLRFVAEDDKTVLSSQIEKYDSLMNEAFVWVKVPNLKGGTKMTFWLYSGNTGDQPLKTETAKGAYDADTTLVYHFGENGTPATDATGLGNNTETAGTPAEGSLIGTGLRLGGTAGLAIPASPSLALAEGGELSWSAWIKPALLQPDSTMFRFRDEANTLRIGVDNGVPFVEVTDANGVRRSPGGAPLAVNVWKHVAVIADASKTVLYVDGEIYATLPGALPAFSGAALVGSAEANTSFAGDIDELEISRVARPAGFIQFATRSQGGGASADQLLQFGDDEVSGGDSAGSHIMEHLSLFGGIAQNMMFDGWVVVFACAIMAVIGWTVAIRKFLYLRRIQKGGDEFLRQWKEVAADLTVLDHTDPENVKSLGGTASAKIQKLMVQSPIYHIYHIGSEEIRHRLQRKSGFNGLSARSIQAIKASLDSGLTHEVHRLNKGLIYLTISIAGGPYVGLLGTVMGVMITFAVIAKTGEVEVNSIAPGIASALLATVAGLIVAIPALFIYSFLNSLIKGVISHMQMFIDEFIAKIAEFYPTPDEHRPFVPAVDLEEAGKR